MGCFTCRSCEPLSKEEQIKELEEYKKALEREVEAVTERIA